jgi:hypothetical protein
MKIEKKIKQNDLINHFAVKLAMGGLGDHYITIQLNFFVKNIITYKMAYRKSELYWMKLVF